MIGASHSNAELMLHGPDLSEICASCGQLQPSSMVVFEDYANDDRQSLYFHGFATRKRGVKV